MESTISIREYARRIGVTEAAVRRAIRTGKIVKGIIPNVKNGRPMVIQSIADREWAASYTGKTNAAPILKERFGFNDAGTPQASAVSITLPTNNEEEQDNLGAISNPRTMRDAQLKEQIYKANMAEIKYNEALGKLVKKEAVYKKFFEFGTQVREAMQSIPDRVIDLILASSSRNEAHEILSAELSRALDTLSNYKNTEKITDDETE